MQTGKLHTYDVGGTATQVFMPNEKSLYGKDKNEKLFFFDLSWIAAKKEKANSSQPSKVFITKDPIGRLFCRPILKNTLPSLF